MWIDINPSELRTLYDNEELSTGTSYAFDFQTKHLITGTNTIHVGETEKIILTAASNREFFNVALSATYPSDYIEFDFADDICEDNITPRNGAITKRGDINNNETPFDFRNVLHRRYSFEPEAWSNTKEYTFGQLVKVNNEIYRWAAPPVVGNSPVGESPTTTDGWVLFIDLDDMPYPFWTTSFSSTQFSENAGYFNPQDVVCGSTYKDYYTFSNANGDQKSEWFHDIVIKKMQGIKYPNIVFVETNNTQTYNARFAGQCNNLTILNNFADNGLIELAHDNFIGTGCKMNKIRQLSKTVIGDKFTENIIHHRVAFDHFGYNVTGNHFLGECVGTTLDHFAQNTIGIDFSFSLALQGSYNIIGNFVWHCFLPNGFSNNQINCPAQDVWMPSVDNKQIIYDGFDYYTQSFNGTNYTFEPITPPNL